MWVFAMEKETERLEKSLIRYCEDWYIRISTGYLVPAQIQKFPAWNTAHIFIKCIF